MRRRARWLSLLLFFGPAMLRSQPAAAPILTVPITSCLAHAGDDPAWSQPGFNDSSWQPARSLAPTAGSPHIWLRCHVQIPASVHPVIAPAIGSAYELFVNGVEIGSCGNLQTGSVTADIAARVFPAPPGAASSPAVVSLRLTPAFEESSQFVERSGPGSDTLRLGDRDVLQAQINSRELDRITAFLIPYTCYLIAGAGGILLLALYLYDRTQRASFWLGITCIMLAMLRLDAVPYYLNLSVPFALQETVWAVGQVGSFTQILFVFALAGRRVPRIYWLVFSIDLIEVSSVIAGQAVPPDLAWRLGTLRVDQFHYVVIYALMIGTTASFVAFWPWRRIPARIRTIALLAMLQSAVDFFWFYQQTPFGHHSMSAVLAYRSYVIAALAIAMTALLLRNQRQANEERAQLRGEMESAAEIQRYLIPETLPPTPGLAIRSVYRPSRDVGGDFFQVLPDARDGSTLIVVGDVAGKGLKAGMLAALIVGAIRTAFQFTSDPGRILALLNERLQGRGLVTCLAMRIDRNGSVELANAGHLPPYINGRELAVDGALPLGALPDTAFPTKRLQLGEGESMVLVSDGVVEARNAKGELFGFDRTAKASSEPAENIARAAQAFGQEDDITVLTLALLPAEVLHA